MIKKVKIEDSKNFYELGSLLKNNFKDFYNLETIMKQNYSFIYGYYINKILVAFLHIEKSYDEIDIINIVVKEDYQGKEIGTKLLNELFTMFKDVVKYHLEVKVSNEKAINLYKKLGFEVVSKRVKYYEGEDGYLMIKEVKK